MLAIGRSGAEIVFFGQEGSKQVKFTCSEEEARGALRQLAALLQPVSATVEYLPVPSTVPPPQQGPNGPIGPPPINNARPPPFLPINQASLADLIGVDPAQEARAKDEREARARGNAESTAVRIVKQVSEEEAAKQEARRQRLLAAAGES